MIVASPSANQPAVALLPAMVQSWGMEAPHGVEMRAVGDTPGEAAMAHGLLRTRTGATLGPHTLDQRRWLVGDVRLDAQDELRAALRAAGSPLRGDECDDLLVLRAYDAWGDGAVDHLLGDYSFALWDSDTHTLLCARDGLGMRPLFFAHVDGTFVCSNVLLAVRAHPQVSAALYEPAVVSFLQHGFNVDPRRTTFAQIRRVPSAQQFSVSAERGIHGEREHWTFPNPAPLRYADARDYVEHFRALLGDVVRDRLRLPRVGIQLSGGLDSPSLAATARRVAPEVRLDGFTIDYSSRMADDEARLASLVAHQLGMRHQVHNGWSPPLEYVDDASLRFPEPLDALDFAEVRREAARLAAVSSVVINGEDGDALFAPPGLLTMARAWGWGSVLGSTVRYAASYGRVPHTGLWLRRRVRDAWRERGAAPPSFVRRDVARRVGEVPIVTALRHPTRPEAVEYLSSTFWQNLIELSRPSWTGAPVETVWPFRDSRLLAFVFSIPPIPWCQRKTLIRVAFQGELPDEVLARPKTPLRAMGEVTEADVRERVTGRSAKLTVQSDSFLDTAKLLHFLSMWREGPEFWPALRALQLDRWLAGLD